MNKQPVRGWRFTHPDLDVADLFNDGRASAGIGLSPKGSVPLVSGAQAIRQSILLLLSTTPGERVMRPQYGCHIHRLIFSPNDDTTAGLAIHYIKRALKRWEPRIDILKIDAYRHEEQPELLNIVLEYRVQATQRLESLAFSFNLTGETV